MANGRPQLRETYSPISEYLREKLGYCCEPITCVHPRGQFCGTCFWQGVSIPVEYIPPCSKCTIDTDEVKKQSKVSKQVEVEPKCCLSCVWWDWFDKRRRDMCGCKCDSEDFYAISFTREEYKIKTCKCGKLAYKEKEQRKDKLK